MSDAIEIEDRVLCDQLLLTLKPRQRLAVQLWMRNRTLKEIGEIIGPVSPGRAGHIVNQGVRRLREKLFKWHRIDWDPTPQPYEPKSTVDWIQTAPQRPAWAAHPEPKRVELVELFLRHEDHTEIYRCHAIDGVPDENWTLSRTLYRD